MRKGICHLVFVAFNVYNITIKAIEEVLPSYMVTSRMLFSLKIHQGLVVSDHHEFTAASQFIKPFSECLKNAQGLQFVSKVTTLSGSKFLRHEGGWPRCFPVGTLGYPVRACISDDPHLIVQFFLICGIGRNTPTDRFQDWHL